MTQAKTLDYIQIEPKTSAKLSVIWLHGLGADGHDFANLVPQLRLPEALAIRFIFPHAPIRPVSINNNFPMRAWFDIYNLSDLQREDITGLKETELFIHALIEEQIASGLKPSQIILAGFSQGGAAALYTGLRFSQKLGGIIALSTYLPTPHQLSSEANSNNLHTPIFLAHGQWDQVIALASAEKSRDILLSLNYPVDWHNYAMGHEVCAQEVQDLTNWFKGISRN
jgi:phospholipase/carboxylesterase